MTNRQKQILSEIIRLYADSAEPVSSRELARLFALSSATIRSEMGVLEAQGYIFQPHVSAGRVPTDKGAWHRFAERGNPEIGGNFILSAHSFVWGPTPSSVNEKSYFYNLKEVKKGDEVAVRWNGKYFFYIVEDTFEVKPNQTEIENKSDEAKLTIYTCKEGGATDGRVVVVAKPKK